MCHTTKLKTINITDVTALEQAVEYLKSEGVRLQFLTNATPRMYSRAQEYQCAYVVKVLDSPYDIGFEKQADGSLYPIFDSYTGAIRRAVGSPSNVRGQTVDEEQLLNISKLIDLYGIHASKNQLIEEGYGYSTEISYDKAEDAYILEVTAGY